MPEFFLSDIFLAIICFLIAGISGGIVLAMAHEFANKPYILERDEDE